MKLTLLLIGLAWAVWARLKELAEEERSTCPKTKPTR